MRIERERFTLYITTDWRSWNKLARASVGEVKFRKRRSTRLERESHSPRNLADSLNNEIKPRGSFSASTRISVRSRPVYGVLSGGFRPPTAVYPVLTPNDDVLASCGRENESQRVWKVQFPVKITKLLYLHLALTNLCTVFINRCHLKNMIPPVMVPTKWLIFR